MPYGVGYYVVFENKAGKQVRGPIRHSQSAAIRDSDVLRKKGLTVYHISETKTK